MDTVRCPKCGTRYAAREMAGMKVCYPCLVQAQPTPRCSDCNNTLAAGNSTHTAYGSFCDACWQKRETNDAHHFRRLSLYWARLNNAYQDIERAARDVCRADVSGDVEQARLALDCLANTIEDFDKRIEGIRAQVKES